MEAWLEYGNVLQNLGAAETAIAAFDTAHAAAPDVPELASAALIAAHFDPSATTASQAMRARAAAEGYAKQAPRVLEPTDRDSNGFGFYSPRFGSGPITSLVLPVLRELRARGVGIVLYSGFDHAEQELRGFREVAHVLRPVAALDDAEFAALIAKDRVGVIFDLCGHAPGNRLRAFASRLAPLQVSWGDWFCTTGLPTMDVFVGDHRTTPEAEDPAYSERVLRLATRFVHALPDRAPSPAPPTEGDRLLASFHRLSKLTEVTLHAWSRILLRIPGSRLLLRAGGLEQPSVCKRSAARFARLSVDSARIGFEPFGDGLATLARYRDVRLALDPFPFNGCVTSCDALAI